MGLGAVLCIFGLALAIVLVANYLEWSNAADGLSVIASVCGGLALAGVALASLGRLAWGAGAPLRTAAPYALLWGGLATAAGFALLLAHLLATGWAPQHARAAAHHGLAIAAGLGAAWAGRRMRQSGPPGISGRGG